MISDLEIRKFEKAYKKELEKWEVMKEAGDHGMISMAEQMQFGDAASLCNRACRHGIR